MLRNPPAPSAHVDRELVVQLRLAVMRLARRLRQQTEGEITASQLSALSSVSRLGPLTLGALAAVERVRPPTMTRIVGHLEAAGLLVRRPAPADRRGAGAPARSGRAPVSLRRGLGNPKGVPQ